MKQKRRKMVRNFISGAMAFCLGVSGFPVAAQEAEGTALGRYVETEVSQPGSSEQMIVKGLVRMEDGRIRIATENYEDGPELWDSYDGGETWELAAVLPQEYGQFYFTEINMCPDGSGAGIGMIEAGARNGKEASETAEESGDADGETAGSFDFDLYYVCFDGEGNAKATLMPEGNVNQIRFTRDGRVLGMSYGGEAWILDRETGELSQELASSASMIGVCGQEGLLLTEDGVLRYDLITGEPLERDEALEEALYSGGEYYGDLTSSGHQIVFAEDEEGRLYYCTRNGIFSHVMGGSVVEQVVDGALCSLSDTSVSVLAMEVADGSFYVIYTGSMGTAGILKYTYDPSVASVPERELTIYSLQEDSGIRQAAVQFQKLYPDTYISYEVGMSGEDGITVSDALRTLNTDILAGNGPDVLILDEMSVDAYAGKGMLTDLSGLLEEISEREGLWENIAYAYQTENTVCAVPARFGIAVAAGEVSVLNRLEDLDSLAELAGEEGTLTWGGMAQLPAALYYSCAGSWKKEDGTIDQDCLMEYVIKLKQIYDNWEDQATEEERESCIESLGFLLNNSGYFKGSVGGSEMSILGGLSKLAVGILLDVIDYAGYTSVNQITGSCKIRLFGGQQEKVYVPLCTLGILNTAREPERAMDFISYLLSREGQTAVGGDGFPVNKSAFRETLEDDTWSGQYSATSGNSDGSAWVDLTYYQPSEEERQWLTDAADSLSVCGETERVQREAVLADTLRCLKGEISPEEAVNSIMQKLNLYLAENQ